MSDKERALEQLEAERRGRGIGLVGETAAVVGEWLQWLWTTPGVVGTMKSPPAKAEAPAFTAPSNARSSYTTTYSRATTPISEEPTPDPEGLEWTYFYVETASPSDGDPGAVEEAQFAVNGDELVLADLDGRIFATSPLERTDDPRTVASRILRRRVGRRPKPLVFPDMGIA